MHIFIDTNIVMHFADPREIDWLSLTNSSECEIVVAPVVIDELDQKKKGHSKPAQRAQAFLKMVLTSIDDPNFEVAKGVKLLVLTEKPSKEFVEASNLIFEEPDQKLLATIIKFKGSLVDQEVRLCTNDVGAITRAKGRNIQILNLPDAYKKAPELSEEEMEIKKLKLENERLKNQIPLISLLSLDLRTFILLEVKAPFDVTIEQYQDARLQEIREKYPPFDLSNRENYRSYRGVPSMNEMRTYNLRLEDFYRKHLEIFQQEFEMFQQDSLYYPINLIVSIGGNIPARNVDVILDFPENLWVERASLIRPRKFDYPEAPFKPEWEGDTPGYRFGVSYRMPKPNEIQPVDLIFGNSTHITKTGAAKRATFHFQNGIKHQAIEELDELIIKFPSFDVVKGFNITYEISADNLPNPVQGNLQVKIVQSKEKPE